MSQEWGALHGVRIVDLSRVLSGPYCTQILADHGATVLKIEPPAGDETRGWGPPFDQDVAAYFQGINRNKHGASLDLSTEDGRERLLTLLEDADVLVENFKAGTMARWGLDYARLAERFPSLVYCSISGFGSDGPLGGLPGYDAAIQAISGIMSINGESDGSATRVGIPIVDLVTGLNATIGILLALQERTRSGKGQEVKLSLFDCALSVLHPHSANYLQSGRIPQRTGNSHPNISPYDVVLTGTDPVFLAVGNDRQFATLCRILGNPALAEAPEFLRNQDRCANRGALMQRLAVHMSDLDGHAIAEQLMHAGVPCSVILNVGQALMHAHTQHDGMIVNIGNYRGIASPIQLSRSPASYRLAPPRRGQGPDAFQNFAQAAPGISE